MAVILKNVEVPTLAATNLTAYQAPVGATGSYSQIRTFTVYASDRDTLSVYIVKSGDSPVAGNLILERTIAAGQTIALASLVNQVLSAGDYISVKAGTGSRINIKTTIKEVS